MVNGGIMSNKSICVFGAGVMGGDIALDLALHHFNVTLIDLSEKILENAKKNITDQYRLMKMMQPKKVSVSLDDVFALIQFDTSYKKVIESSFVIENITENWQAKQSLFTEISPSLLEKTIVCSNTSCIPVSKSASALKYPQKVIGTHFMNPVPMKKLVEVIKAPTTSDETVDKTIDFLKSLDKSPVVVKDAPGFVTNRVLMLTINESIWTIADGLAKPSDVDKIFKLGFGHTMGPLATADLIGLDTILFSLNILYEEFEDSKYRACPLLKQMVYSGKLGRKSGEGFFKY